MERTHQKGFGVHVDARLRLLGMKAEGDLSNVTYHCFLFLVLLILEKWRPDMKLLLLMTHPLMSHLLCSVSPLSPSYAM